MNPARPANAAGAAVDHVRVARPSAEVAAAAVDALVRTGIAARATAPDADGRTELWVDARELDDAATVLAAVVRHGGWETADLAPAGEETGLDGVDGLDDAGDTAAGEDALRTRNPTPSARPYPRPARPRPAPADDDEDDPDDHFHPEEPESLRTLSRTTVWALGILALGVVALALSGLAPAVVGAYAPLASLLGTAAVLVGVGMLVTRLRDGRGDDDDGAVL